MDTHHLDTLSRSLAAGTTRRTVLRCLLGGAAALGGLLGRADAAGQVPLILICHYDPVTNTYQKITTTRQFLFLHRSHGDYSDIGCALGHHLNRDTCTCEPVATLVATHAGGGFTTVIGTGLLPGSVVTYTVQGGGYMESGTMPSAVQADGTFNALREVGCTPESIFGAMGTTSTSGSINSDPITLSDC